MVVAGMEDNCSTTSKVFCNTTVNIMRLNLIG